MSEKNSSEGVEPTRTVSRRRVLGATALAVAGTGGLLASVAPAQARTVDFGDVAVGSSRTQGITTENPVNRPLEVTALTITGSDADEFTIVGGDAPFDLGPNESHTARIRFEPMSSGTKSARVQADTTVRSSLNAGRLTGTGVEEGAASASSEEDSSSESEGASETESDNSSLSSAETDGSSASESNDGDSTDDPATERQATTDPAEESTATSAGASSSETSTTSGETTEESTSDAAGTETSSAPSSNTEDTSGGPENGAGGRLTRILDVNNDGRVNLQDFLIIIRRRGLKVNR